MPKINTKTVVKGALGTAKFISKHAGGNKIPILQSGFNTTDKLLNSKGKQPVDKNKAVQEEKNLDKLNTSMTKVNEKLRKAGQDLMDMKIAYDYAITELVSYYARITLEARHAGIDAKDLFSSAIAYGASSYIKKEFAHLESSKKKYFLINTRMNNAQKTNQEIQKKVNIIKGIEMELTKFEKQIDDFRTEKSTIDKRISDLTEI